jgi:hypothetical protein
MIAAILALAGVFILAPGGALLFDGLPISGPWELISAAGLAVLALSPQAREGLTTSSVVRRLLLTLLVAGLLGKAAVIVRGRYEGFPGCYDGAVTTVRWCRPSYDNPFRLQHATRIDPAIDFDENSWRLGLLNNRDYDFVRDNSPAVMHTSAQELIADSRPKTPHYLPTVPFAAVWQSTVTAPAPATIVVRHVGEGAVEIDGKVTVLDTHLIEPAVITQIPIGAGMHQVVVRYHWAPTVDLAAPTPKKARLSLQAPADVRFGTSTSFDRVLKRSVDVLGAVAFALLFAAGLQHWRVARTLLVPAAIGLIIVVLPVAPWWRDKLLELGMIAACLQWMGRRMAILPFVLLLATLGVMRVGWAAGPAPGVVHYRAWGDDGLSYDSFAREIFENGTLRAGEDSFRGQPLFRYARFVERVLMGEDEWLIVVCALVLFCLAYSWLGRRALDRAPEHVFVILGTTALLLWITGGAIAFVDSAMTEYPTWMLAPIITGLLFLGRSPREHLLAAVLIGVGVLFRFNHLPAYAVLLAIFALRPADSRSSWTMTAAVVGVAGMVVCVPMLAHNLYYGHQWRVIPDSAQLSYDLPIEAWSASTLLARLRYLVHIGTDAPTWFLPLHGLQLIIAGAAAALLAGRWRVNRWHGWLLLAPLAALSVHIVLAVNVYYPRHILFAYLLAGTLVLALAAEDGAACDSVMPQTIQRV